MKFKMTLLAGALMSAAVFTLTMFALSTVAPSIAFARPGIFCRDCPFPAKVGDGRWLMPNGVLQVEIDEEAYRDGLNQVNVTLRDSRSGDVVARGVTFQNRGRRTMTVDLMDRQGRQIKGFVRYLDAKKENIQAKFTCEECSSQFMLD